MLQSGIETIETKSSWTLADLDAAVRGDEVESKDSGGVTLRELLASTGAHDCTIKARLYALKAAGKLTVRMERREGIDGLMHVVPVYMIHG